MRFGGLVTNLPHNFKTKGGKMNLKENKNPDSNYDGTGKVKIYRFDIFKGTMSGDARLEKICSNYDPGKKFPEWKSIIKIE